MSIFDMFPKQTDTEIQDDRFRKILKHAPCEFEHNAICARYGLNLHVNSFMCVLGHKGKVYSDPYMKKLVKGNWFVSKLKGN